MNGLSAVAQLIEAFVEVGVSPRILRRLEPWLVTVFLRANKRHADILRAKSLRGLGYRLATERAGCSKSKFYRDISR